MLKENDLAVLNNKGKELHKAMSGAVFKINGSMNKGDDMFYVATAIDNTFTELLNQTFLIKQDCLIKVKKTTIEIPEEELLNMLKRKENE